MKKNLFHVLSLIMVITLTFLCTSCGNSNNGSTPAATTETKDSGTDTVKIGCLIPFTGLETHNGLAMKYAAEIAAKEVNEAGGVLGKKVELVFEDTAGNADIAAQKAIKMIQSDKVNSLIGTLSVACTYAVFDIANENKMIFMNPTFYTGTLLSDYFFCTGSNPNQVIYPVIDYLKEKGKTSYYFVGSDYVWGTGSIAAAKRHVEEIGGTVVGEEYVPMNTTDYTSIINNIQKAKPDVIFPFVAGTDGVTFAKQLGSFGMIGKYQLAADYFDELLVPALDGNIVKGMINSSSYYTNVDTPENKAFLERLKKDYDSTLMCNFGAGMYHNIKLYCQAVNKAGSIESEKVAQAMKGSSINGLCGNITIDPETNHGIQNTYLAEINEDKTFNIVKVNEQVKPIMEEESK